MIALSTYILVHKFRLFANVADKGIFRLFTSVVFRVGSFYIFVFLSARLYPSHLEGPVS